MCINVHECRLRVKWEMFLIFFTTKDMSIYISVNHQTKAQFVYILQRLDGLHLEIKWFRCRKLIQVASWNGSINWRSICLIQFIDIIRINLLIWKEREWTMNGTLPIKNSLSLNPNTSWSSFRKKLVQTHVYFVIIIDLYSRNVRYYF